MKLELIRDTFTEQATTGRLLIDGKFQCFILEDVVRPDGAPKVHGKTAIPYGTYGVVITMSARFKRLLPLLVNVPNFAGIRIHPGNTSADTEGCLLPGETRGPNAVYSSRVAFGKLFKCLQQAKGGITIEIKKEVSK